jgi:ketosteroid isomerase-like protein
VSRQNVELVRRIYQEGLFGGDPAPLLELMRPEVEYVNPPEAVDPGVRRGREEVAKALAALGEFEWTSHDLHELFDAGDTVVARVTFRARGRASQHQLTQDEAHTWTFREGLIVRLEWGRDLSEALEAVGLTGSQDNIEIVGRAVQAFNDVGMPEAARRFFASDGVFEEPPEQPAPTVAEGRDAAVRLFEQFDEVWDEHLSEIEEIRAVDDERVLVLSVEHFRGRDGIELAQPGGSVYTLRDGKIARLQFFWERENALRAVEERPSGNAAVVRQMWDAFLGGDFQAALAFSHPDIEWDGTNLPDGQVGRGHEAVMDHIRRWADQWEAWTVEVEEIIDAGGHRVVVLIRERGRSKSGAEMDELHGELYDLRDGLVARRQGFSDPREALEAAGLSE